MKSDVKEYALAYGGNTAALASRRCYESLVSNTMDFKNRELELLAKKDKFLLYAAELKIEES